jgi:KDO2-lipid IV(A) lauroyltransferase
LRNIDFIRSNLKGGIIFSGHIGNWELGPKSFLYHGINVNTVYRPLNNPYVEKMTASIRGTSLITKSISGSRKIIESIKKGEYVIILADQKTSEGEAVEFFHDQAITTTSIARIALKYGVPIIPARSIRIDKTSKFRVEVEKPLAFKKTDSINNDVIKLTRAINCKLEEWITEYPSQWFWVHNRWKK